jgi:beta-lactamase superfamily II metal-dependent hydrolase
MFRRSSIAAIALIVLGYGFVPSAFAQEAYYLAIQGEGTACVLIPREGKKAYIIDGGKAQTGLRTATLDDEPVLDALWKRKVEHLVIICSHPHNDHMGGLVSMIRDDRAFRRFWTESRGKSHSSVFSRVLMAMKAQKKQSI